MNEIKQKIKGREEPICPKCFHHNVCRAVDNQPCVECNLFVSSDDVHTIAHCQECKHWFEGDSDYAPLCYLHNVHTVDDDFCSYWRANKVETRAEKE